MVVVVVLVTAALGITALVMVGGLAWYWRGIGRAARLAGPGAWATACVDPTNPHAWRALVIDGTGIRLSRTDGRQVGAWAWPVVSGAAEGPVRPFGSAVAHRGLQLSLTDGSSVEFLFPSRSTLRYPSDLLRRVVQELARYGKG